MSEPNGPLESKGPLESELNLPPDTFGHMSREEADAEATNSDCACTMFAVVNGDGTLARGFRAVSSEKIFTGSYEVKFNRDVSQCAYVATIGLSTSVLVEKPGEITVVAADGDPDTVFVKTSSSFGFEADRGFHLAVHCHR
jgi:hypothetical protein